MLNGFGHIENLGAFILWLLKGFRGSFKDYKKGYTAPDGPSMSRHR